MEEGWWLGGLKRKKTRFSEAVVFEISSLCSIVSMSR